MRDLVCGGRNFGHIKKAGIPVKEVEYNLEIINEPTVQEPTI